MSSVLKQLNEFKTLAQKEVEDTIRRTENIISYYTIRQELFDPVLVELEKNLQVLSVSLDTSSVDLSVAGNKDTLNLVFKILRKAQFEPDSRPKEAEPSFHTHFVHPTGARFWLNFSSTSCKRVQVGVKTVEQPVYEVQCE